MLWSMWEIEILRYWWTCKTNISWKDIRCWIYIGVVVALLIQSDMVAFTYHVLNVFLWHYVSNETNCLANSIFCAVQWQLKFKRCIQLHAGSFHLVLTNIQLEMVTYDHVAHGRDKKRHICHARCCQEFYKTLLQLKRARLNKLYQSKWQNNVIRANGNQNLRHQQSKQMLSMMPMEESGLVGVRNCAA